MKTKDQDKQGWLQSNLQDPKFQRLYQREDLIEDFLGGIEEELERQGLSRKDLAERLGCRPANVTQIMRRTRNLTANTIVDIAFALGLKLKLSMRYSRPTVTWSQTQNVVHVSTWKRAAMSRPDFISDDKGSLATSNDAPTQLAS
jgi:plasmid maintenance system antidote protein VapI